ncbi:glutaminyl-peptide cyclotransferase [Myxococcaceae bacterium GXIMD 01537]
MSTRPLAGLLCALAASCSGAQPPVTGTEEPTPRQLVVRVLKRHPHATEAFTQGLVFHGGHLFESTGKEGGLRRLTLERAAPVWEEPLPGVFPEGLASDGERLYQLTWKNEKLFVWEGMPPRLQRTVPYSGEGWGLCFHKGQLVRSDGSATLRFHDPTTFAEVAQRQVTLQGKPVKWLNELECAEDGIYANVWVSTTVVRNSRIVRIDPETGAVTAVIDASALVREVDLARDDPEAALNGIAIDPATRHFFLTGKHWPTLFEAVFEPAPTSAP